MLKIYFPLSHFKSMYCLLHFERNGNVETTESCFHPKGVPRWEFGRWRSVGGMWEHQPLFKFFFCPRVWASDAPSVVLSVSSLQHSSTLTSNSAEQAATMHTHCLLHSRPHSSLNSLPSGHRLLRRWRQYLMSLHVPLAITTGFTHDLCQQMPA